MGGYSRTTVTIRSNPAGADIEVDEAMVGMTPSTVQLADGEHQVTLKKSGHLAWVKKITVSGGDVKLEADLVKEEASSK